VDIINAAQACPTGVLIALDRQEKGVNEISAITEVEQQFSMPVNAIISLSNIIEFLQAEPNKLAELNAIEQYQQSYGV
jgi:orotate phosphoribosyltransferase